MKLTFYTDYSLRVLLYLAHESDRSVTITELAEFYDISRNHLVKVVHQLGINGFIKTTRGRAGGIVLGKKPNEISVGSVVRLSEPDIDLLDCLSELQGNVYPVLLFIALCPSLQSVFITCRRKSWQASRSAPAGTGKPPTASKSA